jgi:hypothetical protein
MPPATHAADGLTNTIHVTTASPVDVPAVSGEIRSLLPAATAASVGSPPAG